MKSLMALTVIAPPPVEPVTIQQVFRHLRLDSVDSPEDHPDYEDVVLKMKAARRFCEKRTGKAFVQQTIRAIGSDMRLLRGPIISILAVSYYDTDNELQTVDPENYYLPDGEAVVSWASGYSLPALYSRADALRVDYLAGYPPGEPPEDYDDEDPPYYLADNVPEDLKAAILFDIQLQYDDLRPDQRAAIERARDNILEQHAEIVFA